MIWKPWLERHKPQQWRYSRWHWPQEWRTQPQQQSIRPPKRHRPVVGRICPGHLHQHKKRNVKQKGEKNIDHGWLKSNASSHPGLRLWSDIGHTQINILYRKLSWQDVSLTFFEDLQVVVVVWNMMEHRSNCRKARCTIGTGVLVRQRAHKTGPQAVASNKG